MIPKRTEADQRLSICCQLIPKFKVKQCYLIYSMPSLVIFIPISSFTWSKSHNFKTTRICVRLSSVVFKICGQWSVNVSYNLRSEVHCMQSVICSPQSVVCSLQSTAAVYKCQTPQLNMAYVHVHVHATLTTYIKKSKQPNKHQLNPGKS